MIVIEDSILKDKKQLTKDIFLFILETNIAQQAKPGQFVEVLVSEKIDPLLRRPLGVHLVDLKNNMLSLLFRIRGSGTDLLSKKEVGEKINLHGPLGNGFEINSSKNVAVVSGGMGVAPLGELIKVLNAKKVQVDLFYGACTGDECVQLDILEKLTDKITITTDDGSQGEKAFVTQPFAKQLKAKKYDQIYACGPQIMLKEVAKLAKKNSIPCQVSLEEKMACGFGVCLSCAVDTINGKQRVCKEGPVFWAKDIIWS